MANAISFVPRILALVKVWHGLSRVLFGLLTAAIVLVLPGCATFSVSVNQMEKATANRDLDGAIKALDILKLSGPDEALYHLNKGTLLRLQGKYAESNRHFDAAKSLMERFNAISVTEQLASITVNDTMKAYEGLPGEQLMVYAFESLNYLQSGDVEGAAVEARQFDVKQRLIAEKNNANYLSGAFVRYLNSMIFEAAGEKDEARIEMENAVAAYKAQNSLPVPKSLTDDLKRRSEGKSAPSEAVFILHNGMGPTLSETVVRVVNPQPQTGSAVFSLAVPKLTKRYVPVARIVMSSEGASATSEIVEDVNDIAERSLKDRLPNIIARGVARMVAKNVAVTEAKKKGGTLAGFFTNLTTTVSERADTRSWSLLPGNILMARLPLSAGTHDLSISYYSASGDVLETHEFNEVLIRPGRKVFISDYFINQPVRTRAP